MGYDEGPEEHEVEIASLYNKLEHVILPMYYLRPEAYAEVRRSAITVNGSFFNTQRMVSQYLLNAYFPKITLNRKNLFEDQAVLSERISRQK